MSWMYQLHMCYAWYSTWVFSVYCGHLGFWGLGRLHIVHCLPEKCMFLNVDQRSHCHLLHTEFLLKQSYMYSIWRKHSTTPLYSLMVTVVQTERLMFWSGIWCVDLHRATGNYSSASPKMRGQALIPEWLSVLHMWTVWFPPHQFISLHCNAQQHIWNHLEVFFISFQLLISI